MSAEAQRAEEAARVAFQTYLAGRRVRQDLLPRLSRGMQREGKDWLFTIVLADEEADGSKGLAEDLIQPPSKVIATIRVDGETGQASIENWDIPIWETGPSR